MTGKERIYRAMDFKTPDCLPKITDNPNEVSDVYILEWNEIVPWKNWDNWREMRYDHWHCGWSKVDERNMGQVTDHPLADWENLANYQWPDPNDPALYEGMEERLRGHEHQFVETHIFMLLFERLHSLRGFENAMMDLYIEREKLEYLADRIVDFDIAVIHNVAKRFPGQIDGLAFSDDWGTETNLFIHPDLWREFFKPRYKKIFDAAKAYGWRIYMHSCGKINAIIGDLIEIGVNALNLQQPTVLNIEETGKEYAGKVCFATQCDIQRTLPSKGREEIREEVQKLLEHWGTPEGGFIFADDDDNYGALNIAAEKRAWMIEAFDEFDPWKNDHMKECEGL